MSHRLILYYIKNVVRKGWPSPRQREAPASLDPGLRCVESYCQAVVSFALASLV